MKQITSTEFQKSYSRLTEPHEVTALGRAIGTYFPVGSSIDSRFTSGIRPGEPVTPDPFGGSFGSSRPAPKPTRKK